MHFCPFSSQCLIENILTLKLSKMGRKLKQHDRLPLPLSAWRVDTTLIKILDQLELKVINAH